MTVRLAAAIVGAAAFLHGCTSFADRDEEKPRPAPRHVAAAHGEAVVTLTAPEQQRAGIRVAELPATPEPEQIRGFGSVVDPQSIADLRRRYAAAQAELQRARVQLHAAQLEYRRLGSLYRSGGAASARAVEAGTAQYQTSEAVAAAAVVPVQEIAGAASNLWGPIAGGWITSGAAEIERLLSRQDVLLMVTLPPGTSLGSPPATAFVQAGGGPRIAARLVSEVPRTDPHIQGLTYLYLAPAEATLVPGMAVLAHLPGGKTITGPVVPDAAVVWWNGVAWVYVETSPTTFARRQISVEHPGSAGGYVVPALPDRTRVVVVGAQMLLSQQLRAETGEAEEED